MDELIIITDYDECEEYGICGDEWAALCVNKPGSYECVCKTGFSKQGKKQLCKGMYAYLHMWKACMLTLYVQSQGSF